MTIRERIELARQNAEEAVLLEREGMGSKAILGKVYYAMMNCLFVLLGIREIGSLTHADLIGRFEREYVETGKADAAVLEVLRRSYDLTHECDCDHMPVPTETEIRAALAAGRELIAAAERVAEMEVREHENSVVRRG